MTPLLLIRKQLKTGFSSEKGKKTVFFVQIVNLSCTPKYQCFRYLQSQKCTVVQFV